MTELNDLIIQVQEGDIDAFEPVVHRFQDMAVGYAYAILQDWHLAEDAAQEAFISAFLDLPASTVKMRLYHARKQLIEEQLPENRPSSDNTFTEKIMSFQVQTKTIQRQQVLSISRQASMKDLQAHLDGGIKTLTVYAQSESKYGESQDIEIDGLPFAIYHKRDSVEELLVEICLPVRGSIEATKEIDVKELPAVEVAFTRTTLRQSVFPGLLKAYEAIEEWFRTTDHQTLGSPREIYLNYDHSIFSAAAKWEDPCLEIAWPYQPSK